MPSERIVLHLPKDLLAEVTAYQRATQIISRAEAVRRLVHAALDRVPPRGADVCADEVE